MKAYKISIITLFCLLTSNLTNAQQSFSFIKILDRSNNKPISYCTVTCLKEEIGGFADSLGVIKINNLITCDTLVISGIGFKKEKLNLAEAEYNKRDTLIFFLTPEVLQLEEIHIVGTAKANVHLKYDLGHYYSKKNVIDKTSLLGRTNALFIKNTNSNTKKIVKILYSIIAENKSTVRLQLYRKAENSDSPGVPLINENIIVEVKKGQDKIVYDISKYNIFLPEEGVYVAIQWLGEIKSKFNNVSPSINAHRNNDDSIVFYKFLDKEWRRMKLYNLKTNEEMLLYVPNFGISVIEYK